MRGAATRARISVLVSVDVPVAEKPQVEAKRSRGWGRESRPNSRRQWSRWHPGKRYATWPQANSCAAHLRIILRRMGYHRGFLGSCQREEGEKRGGEGKKATRSDEWHNWISRRVDSSLRLDHARPRTLTKIPVLRYSGETKTLKYLEV